MNSDRSFYPHGTMRRHIPIILFTYFNPLLSFGFEKFCVMASNAGVSGLIIPDLPLEEAYKHIFGFTIVNDGSVRDWQIHSIFAGKNFECSSSCGPCILVNQEGLRPEDFVLTTRLNNKLVQDTKIKNMTFSCAEIVVYISKILTIKPGDVIATGSPDGSGISRNPNRFLRNGDCLEIEISNIGILRNNILSHD